ncbi:hypothetical protein GCM10025772_21770 [Ferrimonas gelatinilytica]|uniref:Uncharacterized protein n=1 Tax=Ferrimonas gelatinilytica TaxID=1255257 RepID=A0ABP9SAK4_9GAMM
MLRDHLCTMDLIKPLDRCSGGKGGFDMLTICLDGGGQIANMQPQVQPGKDSLRLTAAPAGRERQHVEGGWPIRTKADQ